MIKADLTTSNAHVPDPRNPTGPWNRRPRHDRRGASTRPTLAKTITTEVKITNDEQRRAPTHPVNDQGQYTPHRPRSYLGTFLVEVPKLIDKSWGQTVRHRAGQVPRAGSTKPTMFDRFWPTGPLSDVDNFRSYSSNDQ